MAKSVAADPRIGSELAGYRIERLLGRGGMSIVYLAYDPGLDRRVALKLISPELSEDESFRNRFRIEWRRAASIEHPNVVPVYDAGEADGQLYIAMRYIEGTDLKVLLQSEGALDPGRTLNLVSQAAEGLDAAHARGLVHRDVKPSNVLIGREGEKEFAYLADFGLTKPASTAEEARESIQLSGTTDYVSPEQIADGSAEARSDIYALGALLYESLTGEVPYPHKRKLQVLVAHVNEPPPKATDLRPELPGPIDDVIAKAMAKEPEDRYESSAALVEAARSVLGLDRDTSGLTRRRLLLLAASLAIVVAAAVASVLLLTGGDEAAVGDDWTRVPHNEAAFGSTQGTRAEGVTAGQTGLLVTVGTDGREQEGGSDFAAWTSPDGVTWTRAFNEDPRSPGWRAGTSVVEGPGPSGFTAVGSEVLADSDGNPGEIHAAVWRSSDGAGWRRVPHNEEIFGGSDNQAMFDVTLGGPSLVAVGHDIGRAQAAVWTSPDGGSWSRVAPDPELFGSAAATGIGRSASGDPNEVVIATGVTAAEDGHLVAIGTDWSAFDTPPTGLAWVSQDGVSWTRAVHDDAAFGDRESIGVELWDVSLGGPGFVAVGVEADGFGGFTYNAFEIPGPNYDAVILTSEDGLTWSRVPKDQLPGGGENVRLNTIALGEPGLVVAGWHYAEPGVIDTDIDPVVWISQDESTWTEAADPDGALTQPNSQLIAEVTAGGPGLVAIGQDGSSGGFNTAVWTSP